MTSKTATEPKSASPARVWSVSLLASSWNVSSLYMSLFIHAIPSLELDRRVEYILY